LVISERMEHSPTPLRANSKTRENQTIFTGRIRPPLP
jgi:hypothetical protein